MTKPRTLEQMIRLYDESRVELFQMESIYQETKRIIEHEIEEKIKTHYGKHLYHIDKKDYLFFKTACSSYDACFNLYIALVLRDVPKELRRLCGALKHSLETKRPIWWSQIDNKNKNKLFKIFHYEIQVENIHKITSGISGRRLDLYDYIISN